ncbi:hypothetical protein [Clostridium beijerinckii]|uniref:Phenazine biosynthesis protein n=1 Tax=Clostridium beijerinckii TaxID=1520 RepID=A0AAE5H911_CLOBE|nr:hypothetical protein [Clostridium beijerinckii]ALB48728.2 phenazine biosynthesis protein [Clostridium beijerinckii NRRL B-598]NSB17163.1 hypothetical protein [Clostridium beijerinckii]OOM23188.1 hypothetical protein CLOBE_41740 [Clostridium beijerinckii]
MLDLFNLKEAYKKVSIDDVVVSTIKWHFSEETGSKYWLEKKRTLDFDPLIDIKSFDDLQKFDDITEDFRHIKAEDLIPKGLMKLGWNFSVFESGGTTGKPQRITDMYSRGKSLDWVNELMDRVGIEGEQNGNWLHIGPTGPHIVGKSIGRLAKEKKKLCYYIDFDPRWVKKAAKSGNKELIREYVKHILEQMEDVLRSQNISVLFLTPSVLEAISKSEQAVELINNKVSAIIWAGTSMDEENLFAYENYLFPKVKFFGLYGNTLMGIAPQREKYSDDNYSCVYQSFYPFSVIKVVDFDNQLKQVEYGQTGQVCISLMTPDIFIPWHLERDQVVRIKPQGKYTWDGVANVKPITSLEDSIVEGVY